MRCIIQRVSRAQVEVEGELVGQIANGLMVLVCAMRGDEAENAQRLAKKVCSLRIFSDEAGKMNLSLLDTGGSVLAVSQFTLAADTSRGNRPGFSAAAPPDLGEKLFEDFCQSLREQGVEVATGRFGAEMEVSLTNAGPVTISLEI